MALHRGRRPDGAERVLQRLLRGRSGPVEDELLLRQQQVDVDLELLASGRNPAGGEPAGQQIREPVGEHLRRLFHRPRQRFGLRNVVQDDALPHGR